MLSPLGERRKCLSSTRCQHWNMPCGCGVLLRPNKWINRIARENSAAHIDSLAATISRFHGSLLRQKRIGIWFRCCRIFGDIENFRAITNIAERQQDEPGLTALRHAGEVEYTKCLPDSSSAVQEALFANVMAIAPRHISSYRSAAHSFDGIEFDPALRWIDVYE